MTRPASKGRKTKARKWSGWMVFTKRGAPMRWASGVTRRDAITSYWLVVRESSITAPLPYGMTARPVTITLKGGK